MSSSSNDLMLFDNFLDDDVCAFMLPKKKSIGKTSTKHNHDFALFKSKKVCMPNQKTVENLLLKQIFSALRHRLRKKLSCEMDTGRMEVDPPDKPELSRQGADRKPFRGRGLPNVGESCFPGSLLQLYATDRPSAPQVGQPGDRDEEKPKSGGTAGDKDAGATTGRLYFGGKHKR